MQAETKTCQNCKTAFTIAPEDFLFYEKIKVPPPTWCSNCQLQRRLTFRNERTLYRRKEDAHGKEIISMYSPDKSGAVYSQEYWWSDAWDPLQYAQDYDFSKPFFVQFAELMRRVPWPALINMNATNSEYCNYTTGNKNCYLVFGGDFNEDCAYAAFNFHTRDAMDLYFVNKGELSYELLDSHDCYKVFFGQYVKNSTDSMLLFNCANCIDCIGCVNLRNKKYCILNVQYTKDEYEKNVHELDLGSFEKLEAFKTRFEKLKLSQPHRHAEILNAEQSTGQNIQNAKNCVNCFDIYDNAEDCKNVVLGGWGLKDTRNADHVGHNAELVYDSLGTFSGSSLVRFSFFTAGSFDVSYSMNSSASSNLFGCVGLRHRSFCILNKQYTEEQYKELVPKIIAQMQSMPYVDRTGRQYTYGDFFPAEFSFFAYNETVAREYFPLSKEQATVHGYLWKDQEDKQRGAILTPDTLPDRIATVPDAFVKDSIGCMHDGKCTDGCTTAFRIIPRELDFYRRMNLPLPRFCPNCRHANRMTQRNSITLYTRRCNCEGPNSINGVYKNSVNHIHGSASCPNQFQTTYAPDRPETIYCEQCYQAEVV